MDIREIDSNTCIVKYLSKREHANALMGGRMLCRHWSFFAQMEDDGDRRSDPSEGVFVHDPVDQTGTRMTIWGPGIPGGKQVFSAEDGLLEYGAQHEHRKFPDVVMYCTTAMPHSDVAQGGVHKHPFDDCKYAVVFRDGRGLVGRIQNALAGPHIGDMHPVSLRQKGLVNYYSEFELFREPHNLVWLFHKRSKYSDQREYRLVFRAPMTSKGGIALPGSGTPWKRGKFLEIGDLRGLGEVVELHRQ